MDSALHLDPEQAADLARVAGSERLVLSHLWPTTDAESCQEVAVARFDGPLEIAGQGRVSTDTEERP